MAFALLIAVVAEVLVLDAGLTWILREPLPASFLAPLIGGLAVAAIGFAGIIFLLAHVFRSTGPVLGAGITLLLLFSLFWLEIVSALALGTGENLGQAYFTLQAVRSQLLAPPLYPNMVAGLLTGVFNVGGVSFGSYAISGSTGLLTWEVGLVGALWIVGPFLAVYWVAAEQD